jgi:hypothetical protein
MAREVPYGMRLEGGAGMPLGNWKSGVTVRKSASGKITKTGSVSKKKKTEVESTSYRGKELTKAERKKIREQNKAAESAKSKDLDKVEAAKRAAKTRKLRQEEKEDYAFMLGKKKGEKSGKVKGAAATAVLGSAIYSLGEKKKKEDKKSKSNKKKK